MSSSHKVSKDDKLRPTSNKQNVVHLRFIVVYRNARTRIRVSGGRLWIRSDRATLGFGAGDSPGCPAWCCGLRFAWVSSSVRWRIIPA